jgi:hypothetical protein
MIQSLNVTLDVTEARREIDANPQAWNQYRWRTESAQSPHREVSDIWLRYNAIENFGPKFNDEHDSSWYPVIALFPSLCVLAIDLMDMIEGERLGGVLLTKMEPGKQVYPHADRGWHASYYDKYAVQIAGNDLQSFCFEDSSLSAHDGEVYTFDNSKPHWVINESDEDRITLIVCIRRNH